MGIVTLLGWKHLECSPCILLTVQPSNCSGRDVPVMQHLSRCSHLLSTWQTPHPSRRCFPSSWWLPRCSGGDTMAREGLRWGPVPGCLLHTLCGCSSAPLVSLLSAPIDVDALSLDHAELQKYGLCAGLSLWYQQQGHWGGLVGFGAAALASVVSLQVEWAPHGTWDFARAQCIVSADRSRCCRGL